MRTRRIAIAALAVFGITAGLDAQTTTTQTTAAGKQTVQETAIATGSVVWVEGNWLLVKLEPSGRYQFFNVPPGRQFIIDGQPRTIADLKPGIILTATVLTSAQPATERTTTVTNGTVWFVSGNYVIVTLENGQNRGYTVQPSYEFMVNGKPATVANLKKGMKVSATKIVSEPTTEFSTTMVVTGKSPK